MKTYLSSGANSTRSAVLHKLLAVALFQLLFCLGFARAQLPLPSVFTTIYIGNFTQAFFEVDRRIPTNVYFDGTVTVDASAPVAAEKVDLYVGLIRPDGGLLTWLTGAPANQALQLNPGMNALVRGLPLSGGIEHITQLPNVGLLLGNFGPSDLPGIYQWFALLVRAGQPVEKTDQWISLRTRMFPVK